MIPRASRKAIWVALLAGFLTGLALFVGGAAFGAAAEEGCAKVPQLPTIRLVYELEVGTEKVSPATLTRTVKTVCERLVALGVGDGSVDALGGRKIAVTLPRPASTRTREAVDLAGASGGVSLYDWEANLIGRERVVGGHPGREAPRRTLRAAEREWRQAGRSVRSPENAQLISAGAMPTLFAAVQLASARHPRRGCGGCSALTPHFYLFGRGPRHALKAGPVDSRAGLRADAAGRRGAVVLRVPVGTAIASEYPTNEMGMLDTAAKPGWFALVDRPALAGSELVEILATTDQIGIPAITFGFTGRGRRAFRRVTRAIAKRGRASTIGPVGAAEAASLSGHIAVALDGQVKSRPIINFVENPNGIDGRAGAQISGGFRNLAQARALASVMGIGALPLGLRLVGQRTLGP
jgi:SecD/SecF fusion protein